MELNNKRVLVVGTGLSGVAATKLLMKTGAYVTVLESNTKTTATDIKNKLPEDFSGKIIIGELPQTEMSNIELVVLSPGVPTDIPMVNELRDRRVPIWGEIELAYQFAKGRMIAITGTNGKTTTTALVGEIMKTYFESVFVVGNIGTPYANVVEKLTNDSITVAEMSSFQLETVHSFKPDVSAILNITPDHLNRHHTMENYIAAKARILENQDRNDTCVLNYEDEVLRKFGEQVHTKVVYFSSLRKLDHGIYLDGEDIIYKDESTHELICNIHELNIIGRHSYENAMAAIAMSIAMNVPLEYIRKGLKSFVAVEHRIEYVDTINGVKYYNDSKGTNPDAAIKAIQAMTTPTLLIGGGYDKDSEYDEWIRAFDGKVKLFVLLGQTREKISDTAKKYGIENVVLVDSLEEAVQLCAKHAKPGDAVLLSPACASWGMFTNYEERGRLFKDYVRSMKQ